MVTVNLFGQNLTELLLALLLISELGNSFAAEGLESIAVSKILLLLHHVGWKNKPYPKKLKFRIHCVTVVILEPKQTEGRE